jgi:hypothetical protein
VQQLSKTTNDIGALIPRIILLFIMVGSPAPHGFIAWYIHFACLTEPGPG